MADVVVALRGVTKEYGNGEARQRVLHGVDLELRTDDFAALIGPSGSGKSTLLNILGLLDRPSTGELRVRGVDVNTLNEQQRTKLRGSALGFVFQFHHLLPAFTALENVLMPRRIQGHVRDADRRWARELLAEVGIAEKADRLATELSGGQQQRVAIARAMMTRPSLILADEPTGNLDSESSEQAFALMERLHAEQQVAFLIVTHDPRIAGRCRRVVEIADGRIRVDREQTPRRMSGVAPEAGARSP